MAASSSVTIKSRPLAGGRVAYYLYFRPALPDGTTLLRVDGFDKPEDRPKVEEFAKPYRKALASLPKVETSSDWFDRYVDLHGQLGNGTSQHAGDWRKWVEPTIGKKPMAGITSEDVKAIRDGLTRARLDGKISAKRAMNVWSTVVKAPFSRAWTDDDPKYSSVRVGPYAANPAIGIKPPVTKDDCEEDERERQALEPSEALALLSCEAISLDTRRFYAWAMFTGLRPAELYGLMWNDVRDAVIKVQRSRDMKSGEDGGTKTRAAVRDVPIHPHLAPLIRTMRTTGRVFPVNEDRVRDVEKRVEELRGHLRAAGINRDELFDGTKTLRPFDVRSFRTTFATWCARSGFDSAWIDAWLGHIPKTTAAKHYVKDTGAMTSGVFPTLPTPFCEPIVNCERSLNDFNNLQCEGRDLNSDHTPIFARDREGSCEPSQRLRTAPDGRHVDGAHRADLVALAAKARLLERLLGGDERVLAGELRAGLEAMLGPVGEVVPIRR